MAERYTSVTDVLNAAQRPGWRIVGTEPQYTEETTKDPATGETVRTRRQTSTRWSIQSPDGTQSDTMEVQDVIDPDVKGGLAIGIVKGPTKNLPAPAKQPTPSGQLDRLDAQGRVIPPSDTTTPVAKLRDPATGTVTDMPDPKTAPEGKTQEFGDSLLLIKADPNSPNGVSVTTIATKTAGQQTPTLHQGPGGSLIEYDPNKPAGERTRVLIEAPPDKTAPQTKEVNGVTYQWDPATNTWTQAAGLPAASKPTTASTNTTAKYLVFYDDQGREVSRQLNPNYVPPEAKQLTSDTVSPYIPMLRPDGTITWQPNQNQVQAGDAMRDLLGQVGVQVNSGDLSMADAKDMLTGAVNAMNAQTSRQQVVRGAASDILQAAQQGAQTGAGLLQQRVSSATSMLNSILGLAGQGQRSGNLGGGLMAAPAGLGEQLVGGIQGWATELGGGKDVFDTAANLVRRADPSSGLNPQAQTAIGVLTDMLDRYRQVTGQDHPLVQANQTVTAAPTTPTTFISPLVAQPSVFRSPQQIDLSNLAPALRGALMG